MVSLVLLSGCATTAALQQESIIPLDRGRAALEQGRIGDAVLALSEHIELHPTNIEGARLLALAHTRRGDFESAVPAWERALDLDAADGDGWRRFGDVLLALSRPVAGGQAYRTAMKYGQNGPQIISRVAQAELSLKRPERALDVIDGALPKHGKAAVLHLVRGQVLITLDRPHEAIKAFRRAGGLDLRDPTPWLEAGRLYEALDFPNKAVSAYQKAMKRAPEHAEVLVRLGRVLVQCGQTIEALPILTRAARLNPDSPAVHNNLGVAYNSAGLMDEAARAFERGLELDDRQASLHSNLAEAYYRQARLQGAEQHLKRSLELEPNRPFALAALRRVVLMRTLIAQQCQVDGKVDPAVMVDALERRWRVEGWAQPFKPHLRTVLADSEAMLLLDKAVSACRIKGAN